jgi:hypothetical protein
LNRIKLEEDWKGSTGREEERINWKRRGKDQLENREDRFRNDEDGKDNEHGEDGKGSAREGWSKDSQDEKGSNWKRLGILGRIKLEERGKDKTGR